MEIICVNCGVKNYFKEDHRGYIRNLCQLGKESLKKNQASTGFRTSVQSQSQFFQVLFSQLHKLHI